MEFKDKLYLRRKELGLTLEQVANAVGVGKSTVRKWETGNIKNLRRDKIAQLSTILQTTPAQLMGWEDLESKEPIPFPPKLTGHEMNVITAYRNQPEMQDPVDRLLGVLKTKFYKPQFHDINLYHFPASAGMGAFLDGNDYDIISVGDEVPKSASFGVRISGDSMAPLYPDGYIAWVEMKPSVEEGKIGIFVINGEGYIKKQGKQEIISLNPAYKPIKLKESDEIRTYGEVIAATADIYTSNYIQSQQERPIYIHDQVSPFSNADALSKNYTESQQHSRYICEQTSPFGKTAAPVTAYKKDFLQLQQEQPRYIHTTDHENQEKVITEDENSNYSSKKKDKNSY